MQIFKQINDRLDKLETRDTGASIIPKRKINNMNRQDLRIGVWNANGILNKELN